MSSKIDEKISKGHIHFSTILEMVGKPKEHVEATLADYIDQIKKSPKYEVISSTTNEAIPVEDSQNLFSTFTEMEVLVLNMRTLFDFCFECMPASIEIIEPTNLSMRPNELSAAVNDLISRIHTLDMESKKLQQQGTIVAENLGIAIKNAIVIYLSQKPRRLEDISVAVGLSEEQLPQVLSQLQKENKVTQVEAGVFAIAGVPVIRPSSKFANNAETAVTSTLYDSRTNLGNEPILKIGKNVEKAVEKVATVEKSTDISNSSNDKSSSDKSSKSAKGKK